MGNLDKLDFDSIRRFEMMAERYIKGSQLERQIILSFLNETEKKTFLEGVGFIRLFTDEYFYKSVRAAVCKQLWKSTHKEVLE
ncbi:MAG: hypothetical protein LUI12_05120 [Clostridiales bacterium]|nr:hypothetical protein [Clostridiales bacterium]